MPSNVDYRGSKLITHDYYWLFSMYGYPLLQTLVCNTAFTPKKLSRLKSGVEFDMNDIFYDFKYLHHF